MGFTKIGGKWVSKDGDQAGSSSGIHAEDDGEPIADTAVGNDGDDAHQAGQDNAGHDGAYDAGPNAGNMDERITFMTPFERLLINRMDSLAYDQRNNHEFYATRFHNLDARFQNLVELIEAIQNQLFELQYGKDD